MRIFYICLSLLLVFNTFQSLAQSKSYAPEAVVDEKFGIQLYEPLNIMLGKDTIRNDENGYAANGFIEDFYTSGQLLHKGFYVDGQLKLYKNYYPNGTIERSFKVTDIDKSKMDLFYPDGKPKSTVEYVGTEAQKWTDYYPNGNVEFTEEYHKSFLYYVFKANYFEDGKPENTLELIHKKKLLYSQKYYHKNGNLKEEGEMQYNKAMFDYERIGTWTQYDESGKAIKKVKYASGKVQNETDL